LLLQRQTLLLQERIQGWIAKAFTATCHETAEFNAPASSVDSTHFGVAAFVSDIIANLRV
jgi:hypothetical protein